jgi:Uma2 family endonuclease
MSVKPSSDEFMSARAFAEWSERQNDRHELLDGVIVAMAAERLIHTKTKLAVANALARAIADAKLPCEAFVDGMAVCVEEGTVFEPDALVRCGEPLPGDTLLIVDPLIVVEVASPSTQRVDALLKLNRYFRNPAITHLIVMPDQRTVVHHRRAAGERIETTICSAGQLRLEPPGMSVEIDALFP